MNFQFITFIFSFVLKLFFKLNLLLIKDLIIKQVVKLVLKQYLVFFYCEPIVKFIQLKIQTKEYQDFFVFIDHFEKANLEILFCQQSQSQLDPLHQLLD